MNSFYSQDELLSIGFRTFGDHVLISRNAKFYGQSDIVIGNNVRIDDFCILSGKITLGSNIHISSFCALYGAYGIEMEDYTGLSPRCTVLSASDDFSGNFLIGPIVEDKLTNVTGGKVIIKKFSQIGTGSVIFPNLIIHEGVAVGAMSFVNDSLAEWSIYSGIPAKKMKDRERGLLELIGQ
jgi:acetyltransferase-like isoleucine patch superfamily enzyme